MNARIVTTSTLAFAMAAAILPARAADPQLLSLVMPDAKVVAGVNVDQAKTTPFGQYVLSQMGTDDQELKKVQALTGFDPTRDVHELLAASNAVAMTGGTAGEQTGLLLARGSFDAARIAAAAQADNAITETYKGVTIIEDPKGTHGVAFLSPVIAVVGDTANVKGAIDRQQGGGPGIPAALTAQVNRWSGMEDAWVVSTVALNTVHAPGTQVIPGLNGQGPFGSVQSAAGGVKFGANVVLTAQAQAATAQDAQQLGDALKMLVMLAQMQASKDPKAGPVATQLANSTQVTTTGSTLNVTLSLPEDVLQQLLGHAEKKAPAMRGGR